MLLIIFLFVSAVVAQNSLLFASCALNADGTALNGLLCNEMTASTYAGCLDNGKAYQCQANTLTWIALSHK